MALVRRYDTEFPSKHFAAMLDYMGLTEEAFWETIETFRSPHLWKRQGNDWVLRHPVA